MLMEGALCPLHTANATQLDSCVTSALYILGYVLS